MAIKLDATEIWKEYNKLVAANVSIDLYNTVKKNENFFIGKQWEGVNAPPGLEKPVFNILKRVISYFVSIIVSDDVTAMLSMTNNCKDDALDQFLKIVSTEIDEVIENTKLKSKNRDAIRNAAVDGDACLYIRFDDTVDIGQMAKGAIDVEIIDNTNIVFGNPQVQDIQKQPFVIIALRKSIEDVKEEAATNGVNGADVDLITVDNNEQLEDKIKEDDKVTVLVKFFKVDSKVHFVKATHNVVIKTDTELGYNLYPLAYFSWDKIKNNYHGQAAVSGLLPNQIFINKLFAMSMEHVRNMAFPKVIYNSTMIPKWDNRVGASIAVNGDPNMALATGFKAPDMSNQVMLLIEKVIQYTRDTMGASDAALGNVKADNTSAIIALQKSSAMPLELQRMDFYQFVEDYIRIIIDIIRVNYGMRNVSYTAENGETVTSPIDFSLLDQLKFKLNVDIGASTYWSEMMQVQTIDNLFAKNIITDAVMYLESIPDGFIKNKQSLIDKIKAKQQEMQQMQLQQQMQMGGGQLEMPIM